MKYQYLRWIKIALTALLMILAGILYSCSRQDEEGFFSDGSGSGALLLVQEDASGHMAGTAPEDGTALPGQDQSAGTADDPSLQMPQTAARTQGQGTAGTADDPSLQMPQTAARAQGQGTAGTADDPSGGSSGAGAEMDTCFVHICGAVASPGVYALPEGSRIYQAVEMAGGFLPEADESYLNLAAMVADGMQIAVYTVEEAETAPASPARIQGGTAAAPGSYSLAGQQGGSAEHPKVDINTAGIKELMTLKGIGESRAEAIVAYREEHGPFQKIEDIMLVPGIKDGAFQKIKEDITI